MQFILEDGGNGKTVNGGCGCGSGRTAEQKEVLTPRDIYELVPKLTITNVAFKRDRIEEAESLKF
jgi:hypothetical protein